MNNKKGLTTGNFCNEKKRTCTKVHLVKLGKPICGSKIGDKSKYQKCANGSHMEYVECSKCMWIHLKLLENELDDLKKEVKEIRNV